MNSNKKRFKNYYNKYYLVIIVLVCIIEPAMGIFNPGEIEYTDYHQFVIKNATPLEFYPSDVKIINITMQNIYNYSAYGVSTVIDKNKTEPIKFTNVLQQYIGDEIYGEANFAVQYEIYIKDTVPKDTYYIPITVRWSPVAGGIVKQQEDLYIGIKVLDNPESVKVDIVNVTTIPEHVKPGDTFKLKVRLRNIGDSKLSQIRAALGIHMPFSSFGSSTDQYVPLLEPNQTTDVFFNIMVDKQAPSSIYNFNFTLEYKDKANNLQSQQSSFGINVEEVPETFIQDITLDPTTLNPNSDGLLMIQVANAGTNEVKNVRLTVFGGDNILTQNQNFIGIIRPGAKESTTASFGIKVDPAINVGEYGLNIQINYEDVTGLYHSISNLYVIKITPAGSLFQSSPDLYDQIKNSIIYGFIFIVISYCIFLIVGTYIEKNESTIKEGGVSTIKEGGVSTIKEGGVSTIKEGGVSTIKEGVEK